MKLTWLVTVSLIFLAACSGQKNQNSAQKLSYDSPIQYVHAKIENKDDAAMVDTTPVSWSQLRSQDPALAELEEKFKSKALAFAYAYALMQVQESNDQDAKITIEFYGEQPETKLKELLASNGLEADKAITVEYASGPVGALAKVGTKTLTTTEFMKSNLAHSKLYKKVFEQRMQRLNGIVVRRYLLEASKEAQMNMEDYVKEKILGPQSDITKEDVMAFAKQRGISESDIDEKMLERLEAIVAQERRDKKIEEFVAKNLIKKPVAVSFEAPQINIQAPELGENIPQWGQSGKAPSLVYIGHWSCENCESPLKSFLQAKETWGKKVNGAFIYSFPDGDREARMGAEAALCVYKQNNSYFWSFMNSILTQPDEGGLEENINAAAKATGADFDQFRQCFLKREFQQAVDTHLVYAKEMGIFKTPLMVANGHVIEAPFDTNTIAAVVKDLGVSKGGSFFASIKNFFSNLF